MRDLGEAEKTLALLKSRAAKKVRGVFFQFPRRRSYSSGGKTLFMFSKVGSRDGYDKESVCAAQRGHRVCGLYLCQLPAETPMPLNGLPRNVSISLMWAPVRLRPSQREKAKA